MSKRLQVWRGDEHVGVFTERGGKTSYSYDEDVKGPISLSLPLDGHATPDAPRNFLVNLLPEDGNARLSAKIASSAESEDPFDLLA